MKYNIIGIFFFFASISAFSQDVIVLKDSSRVNAKVVEISSTSIKYYNFDQPNGPMRVLGTHEISEIIYQDGTSEIFNVSPPVKPRANPSQNERIKKPVKDRIFGRGFFIDGFFGASGRERKYEPYTYAVPNPIIGQNNLIDTRNYFSLGVKIGNKWYFGQSEKWRPGFQATWIRLGAHTRNDNPDNATISLLNVGMCNAFKLNQKLAFEANVMIGPTGCFDSYRNNYLQGMSYSIEAKLRLRKLALGIDYQYSNLKIAFYKYQYNTTQIVWNTFSITVGVKL